MLYRACLRQSSILPTEHMPCNNDEITNTHEAMNNKNTEVPNRLRWSRQHGVNKTYREEQNKANIEIGDHTINSQATSTEFTT